MNEGVKRRLRPVLQRMGLLRSYAREGLALQFSRQAVESRLEARGLRVALIGCGTMGRTIAAAVHSMPGAQLSHLYDQRTEAVERLKGQNFANAYSCRSTDELFECAADFDVVAIATTAQAHYPLAMHAMERGVRRLLVEKPVTTSVADARNLSEQAASRGVIVAVDHTRRWIRSTHGLRRLLRSGAIGKPRSIHFYFGRGGLAMIGTHLVDLARFIFGEDLTSVRGELDNVNRPNWRGEQFKDPSGRLWGTFRSGARLTLDLSEDLPLNQSYYVVIGETGRIEVDEKLAVARLVGAGGRVWEQPFIWPGGLSAGVAAALLQLHRGEQPHCTSMDGAAALEAVAAAHASHRSSSALIHLPLDGNIVDEQFPFA